MVGNNSKEFSTNFIQTGEKEFNVGEVEGGRGGGWYQSYLLKGKGT